MKALYLLCIFLVLSACSFAQDKISKEEKAARREWVERLRKNIPQDAQQRDIKKFYSSLPKSTLDSLHEFELGPGHVHKIVPNKPGQMTYRAIPIPLYTGKEKIIPIPLNDPDVRSIEIRK